MSNVTAISDWVREKEQVNATDIGYSTADNVVSLHPISTDEMQKAIRNLVFTVMAQQILRGLISNDNPFDAVLLSDLEKDEFSITDLKKIKQLASLEDYSDQISFNDEWDD